MVNGQANDFGQLLTDARNGLEQALGELLSRYRGYLLVIGTARMYGDNTKRDVSRELPIHQPNGENGRSLLSGIQGPGSTPSTKEIRQERAEVLQKVLADLPTDQSEIIVRRSIQQESFDAIGQSLGRTPDAVRMQWRRAFSKLVEQMASENV